MLKDINNSVLWSVDCAKQLKISTGGVFSAEKIRSLFLSGNLSFKLRCLIILSLLTFTQAKYQAN